MNKIKSYYFTFMPLLVLMVLAVNLYYKFTNNVNSDIFNNISFVFVALYGFVDGIRYINSNKNKKIGITLITLSSVTIFVNAFLLFLTLRSGM